MRILSVLIVLIFFMVFIFNCGQAESGPKFGTGILKQPVQNLNPQKSNSALDLFVDLPLLLWPSFEYQMIKRPRKDLIDQIRKEEFCVLNESEGTQLQIGAKVEVLDEARCLNVRLNSNDGLPRSYTITLVQIRLIETGEEGWTWSKAVEFDKK